MVPRLARLDSLGQSRVEDYLDDKLQTDADLQNLDLLLDTVRNQQSLLLKQVSYWSLRRFQSEMLIW